jgi:deubiquitinating protein VCIP135
VCYVTKCQLELLYVVCRATFDCGILSDRSFLLNSEHLDVLGYGRDQTGSLSYLAETLRNIEEANGGR